MSDTTPPAFSDFKLNKQLLNAIEEAGYTEPTEIQQKAIPMALAGHDLLGIAQTGTGKTAAFLLPLLMKVKYAQGDHPRAIIMAPTRELALQIAENFEQLSKYTDVRFACVYGGIGPKKQIEAVEAGIDVLIGTPGRIMDVYRAGALITKQVKTLVLDEADRMMDMGFMPQIRQMLEILPTKRQNLLFSATMPPAVLRLSEEFLEFPETVEVTPQSTPAKTVEQYVYSVPNLRTKINLLEHLLKSDEEAFHRVMVFTRTKQVATNVFKYLERKVSGTIRVLHANKGQNSRINAINEFKEGNVRVLVSTDVSARGIDVSMVSHVVNFEVPVMKEDYVHRIGRTGRAGQSGVAITFCNAAEEWYIRRIEKLIQMEIPRLEMPGEVEVTPTPFEERQDIARAIDNQKRKDDPDFKGAFHEKQNIPPKKKTSSKGRNSGNFKKGGSKKRR